MEAVERPQIPVGKLDVRQVFLPSAAATEEKVPILVGKLDTRNLFPAVGVGASSPDEKPAVTVGKLDTRNLFPAAEVAEDKRAAVTVGKLDMRNLFVPQSSPAEDQRPLTVAGKLDTKNIFPAANRVPEERSPPITVGKLDARSLFPAVGAESSGLPAEDRPRQPQVGRLNTHAIFNSINSNSPTEAETEARLYRPTVQPRRLKFDNIFTAASGSDFSPESTFSRLI